ncbi:hypothetical protein [Actinoplanes sp. NPDC051859]|uniref:hypothetical protein n=1 Tax=Actinoplanes sp. NPDC051859 TaxID=3363909 RepID=UPI0037A83D51
MTVLTHLPLQPSLDCSVCKCPWPCALAKAELREEFCGNRTSLTSYLTAYMQSAYREAVADHQWGVADNLYERFLGWVRSNPEKGVR